MEPKKMKKRYSSNSLYTHLQQQELRRILCTICTDVSLSTWCLPRPSLCPSQALSLRPTLLFHHLQRLPASNRKIMRKCLFRMGIIIPSAMLKRYDGKSSLKKISKNESWWKGAASSNENSTFGNWENKISREWRKIQFPVMGKWD